MELFFHLKSHLGNTSIKLPYKMTVLYQSTWFLYLKPSAATTTLRIQASVMWPWLASWIWSYTTLPFVLFLKQTTFYSDSGPSHVWFFLPGTHSSPPSHSCSFSSIYLSSRSRDASAERLFLTPLACCLPCQLSGTKLPLGPNHGPTLTCCVTLFFSFLICKIAIIEGT